MRVIGGSARGRQLADLAGRDIRPTPDRVREALFSILYSRRGPLAESRVLDLFAGSGALGIEALSRGAAHARFVDSAPRALAAIRENLTRCGFTERASVVAGDVWKALPDCAAAGPFDLIFADPPYGRELAPRLLAACAAEALLDTDGILCLEAAADDDVPEQSGTLQRFDRRRYGLTVLHFFQPASEARG